MAGFYQPWGHKGVGSMTDLTLFEYKDLSEEELDIALKEESRKIFHSGPFETDFKDVSNDFHSTQQQSMNREQILPLGKRIADHLICGVMETLVNLSRIGVQIASRMYVHLFYRAS